MSVPMFRFATDWLISLKFFVRNRWEDFFWSASVNFNVISVTLLSMPNFYYDK